LFKVKSYLARYKSSLSNLLLKKIQITNYRKASYLEFQKAALKFSDIVLEKYNTLSTNMNRLGVKELHDLSPLQYPLFTEIKQETSSLLKTSIVIGGSIAFILLLRNKNIDVSEKNIDNPKELHPSEETKNSLDNEELEIVDKEISFLPKKKSSNRCLSNLYGILQ